ncbi:MAG: hypothetical protein KJZ56_11390 [Flavobacteriales bacterium]|nr:hypothetical protein [Flavobacteriales bacterium]
MQKLTILLLILGLGTLSGYGQDNHKELYQKAFDEQHQMLKEEIPIDFKRAVFITENAYHKGTLDYRAFKSEITQTGNKLKNLIKQRGLTGYKTAGNWAVFTFMTDSLPINDFKPYTYDFDDFMGEKDWTKMFTTKLMRTKSGNCHSLPYYYKILCEEIGASAHLTLAPNHIYIKHIDEKGQWTNVELTNGGFPRDQWIIKQMAISVESIKNEIYMKPLTDKESIALTIFDLASAYEFQFGVDSFYLSIIDTALTYFPNCIPLLMSKANYFAKTGMNEQKKNNPNQEILKEMYDNQELIYAQINNLGHKEMPLELYEQWVQSVENEKQKRTINNKK